MRPEEIYRRLGVPRFRHVCPQCGRYVAEVQTVFDWSTTPMQTVDCCAPCAKQVEARNRRHVEEKAKNKVLYERANDDYRASMQRSSDWEYIAACERMRREGF